MASVENRDYWGRSGSDRRPEGKPKGHLSSQLGQDQGGVSGMEKSGQILGLSWPWRMNCLWPGFCLMLRDHGEGRRDSLCLGKSRQGILEEVFLLFELGLEG